MFPPFRLEPPPADATELLRLRDGLYAVDLVGAALVHFDLFTKLGRQPTDLEGVCRACDIQTRPADVMLTLFTALGYVERRAGTFHLTEVGRHYLVGDSPWFLGPYYAALKDRPVCHDYLRVLRTGTPANWGSFKEEKAWAHAMETERFARGFTAAMDCRGRILGPALAERVDLWNRTHVLDVAGGSGVYACALATRYPRLRATVLEKRPVDELARQGIEGFGLADRVRVTVGDMFQDAWPRDCDAHLISNVLHDWDEPEVRALLRRSFESLPPGGLVMVHDAHLNRDKTGPLPVAMYSCLLMHSSEGRCYSVNEMESMLGEAGFAEMSFSPTTADRSVLTALKPSGLGSAQS